MFGKSWNHFKGMPHAPGFDFAERDGRGRGRGRHHESGRHHEGRHHRHDGAPLDFGGRFGHGPWGFLRRGPRAKRGDIRAGILALLKEHPLNGYQIMQELEQRSRGVWRPSPGSVYPALQQLEDEGLIRAESQGTGKVFSLTDKGGDYVREHEADLAAPWDAVGDGADESSFELFAQVRSIGMALFQVVQSGSPAQVDQARSILQEARRALYRILSEDEPSGSPKGGQKRGPKSGPESD